MNGHKWLRMDEDATILAKQPWLDVCRIIILFSFQASVTQLHSEYIWNIPNTQLYILERNISRRILPLNTMVSFNGMLDQEVTVTPICLYKRKEREGKNSSVVLAVYPRIWTKRWTKANRALVQSHSRSQTVWCLPKGWRDPVLSRWGSRLE